MNQNDHFKKYFIYAIMAALLFGLATPLSKLLLNNINPILLAALYYLGAAIFLIPFSHKEFSREIKYLKSNKKDVYRLLGAIIFGGILGPISLLYGIKLTTATTASLLLNLETVATTFLAWVIFKEHISKRVAFSSVLVVIAGSLLVVNFNFELNIGGLLVILGCFFWGLDNNFTATVEGISPQTNTILKGIVAGTFNLILAFISYKIEFNFLAIFYALLIGFFSYGLSITLYIYSARNLGAARSQIMFAINPFLGAIVSFMIFLNPLDYKFYLAFLIMGIATFLLYYEKHGHQHTHTDLEHEHQHSHTDGHHFHQHKNLKDNSTHTHKHQHNSLTHYHLHFPDVHHRHKH